MGTIARLGWPLMDNNITRQDRLQASNFFLEGGSHDLSDTKLTNGPQVSAFEEEFAQVQGSKFAVMVNSGSSANLLSMQALYIKFGCGQVAVPVVTWVSDIAAIMHAGLEPLFMDVDPRTLGIDWTQLNERKPLALFPTHCLGFNAFLGRGFDSLSEVPIVEDCCESLGATMGGKKLGTFGLMSNFSFYYAHHMSTIEGGMICTDDEKLYELLRMLRSHGLVREMRSTAYKEAAAKAAPDLDPQFIFAHLGHNMRSTEVNAVIGRSQLKRLDENNHKRRANLVRFLGALDADKYRIEYLTQGSCNYAMPLVLQEPDQVAFSKVVEIMKELGVEYRKGTAGGGNQLRQPYARERWGDFYQKFPQAEHIHHFGLYVGNYPDLEDWKIDALCERLNAL